MRTLTDPMPDVCLLSQRHSQHSYLVIASGGSERSGGRRGSMLPISESLALSPLSYGILPWSSGPLITVVHRDAKFPLPWGYSQLQVPVKLAQTEPGGSFGRLAVHRQGCDWVLGAPSPLWAREAPLDNLFQVFNLKTKKLFSVAWEWRVLASCIKFFRDGNIWLQ